MHHECDNDDDDNDDDDVLYLVLGHSPSLIFTSSEWSSYDRIWFSGPDKQEMLMLTSSE
jgi:hypothetical protein